MDKINQAIDSLSSDELDLLNSDPKMLADFKNKYSQTQDTQLPVQKPGLLGQAWQDLKIPEEKSREGLKMITDTGVKAQNWLANKTGLPIGTEPTGNVARDLAANTPRILGETLTKVAPGFVSRGAIVTAGLLRGGGKVAGLLKPAANAVAQAGEDLSGLSNVPVKTPGLLREAYQDPGLFLAPGAQEAGSLYGNTTNNIRAQLKYTSGPLDFVEKAMEYANNGSLTTDEALAARQELDGIKNSVSGAFYRNARGVLDYIAKQDYSGADEAYVRGLKADALRSFSGINKNGSPSVARSLITMLNPKTAIAYTPAVQAAIASGAGLAAKGGAAMTQEMPSVAAGYGIGDYLGDVLSGKKKEKSHGK